MLPSRDFFLLLEDIGVDLDLLMLIAHIKLLTGDPGYSFLAIHLLDALQPPLVVLEVILDAVELHNPHLTILYNVDSSKKRTFSRDAHASLALIGRSRSIRDGFSIGVASSTRRLSFSSGVRMAVWGWSDFLRRFQCGGVICWRGGE